MNNTRFSTLFYTRHKGSIKDFLTDFHKVFLSWTKNPDNINDFESWKSFVLATYNAGESEIRKNPELFSLFADLLMQQCDLLPPEMFEASSFLVAQVNYLIEDMSDTEIPELEQKAQELTKYWINKGVVL